MKIQIKDVVVVPWDFSELSRNALERVVEMVGRVSLIRVVHVAQLPSPYEVGAAWDAISEKSMRDHLEKSFRTEMHTDKRFKEISFSVLFGDPGKQICHFSEDHHAELIVVPSHGRSAIARLLLGSVAERIVRFAPCPVLVLRTAPPQEVPETKAPVVAFV